MKSKPSDRCPSAVKVNGHAAGCDFDQGHRGAHRHAVLTLGSRKKKDGFPYLTEVYHVWRT